MAIIARSEVPEDLAHAKNVKTWVKKINPNASPALQIAAVAHDIERALPERKIPRGDYQDFDAFKKAHARNSAKITSEILDSYDLDVAFKSRVKYLIEHHEFGGPQDEELAVLKEADAISFFEVNLPHYAHRHNADEVDFRIRWGYRRLSKPGRKIVQKFRYTNFRLHDLLNKVYSEP